MAAPVIGAVAGAGAGAINHNQKVAEYNRQKELAAQLEQYSPWTGQHGQIPKEKPNLFNSMLLGGMSGATFGMAPGMGGSGGGAAASGSGNPMAGASPWGGVGTQMAGGFEEAPQQRMPTFFDIGGRNRSNWASQIG